MKKKRTDIRIDLPPYTLWLDELNEIFDILNEKCAQVAIETKDYSFDNIDDLQELPKTMIHTLSLEGTHPYIEVNLSPAAYVYCADTDELRGIANRIDEIVTRAQRYGWYVFLGLSFMGMILGAYSLLWSLRQKEFLWAIINGIATIIVFRCWMLFSLKAKSYIMLRKRTEVKSFFVRNKDDILKILITACLTIAGTLLVQWLLS